MLSVTLSSEAQLKTDKFIKDILTHPGNSLFNSVLEDPVKYRCQVIYTQINRDRRNRPRFRNYYFNYDPDLYFNPASMVKMPLALLALEKLHKLNRAGVDKYTSIKFDSSYPAQQSLYTDSTSSSGLPSIAHFIKRAFLISENDPYNRLYQFMGQQAINRNLHAKGYRDVRIMRQFMGFTYEGNQHTNALSFIDKKGNVVYSQPAAYNADSFNLSRKIQIGTGYFNRNNTLINEPFDFTAHNNLPLRDMKQMLQSILFPQSVSKIQRFELANDDYAFLYQYLSQYPSETSYPKYDTSLFYDSYAKFFFRDSTHSMPAGVRVFNKVGWAYGFLTDVSYVADFTNNVEYMLAATIYVNSDNILNDDKYDYDSIGYPFLYHLGQTVYRYELNRKRKFKADLSALKIIYDYRDPADKRTPIKEVDN